MMDDDTEAYEDQGPEEPAALDTEAEVTCPHCGATVSLSLDPERPRKEVGARLARGLPPTAHGA